MKLVISIIVAYLVCAYSPINAAIGMRIPTMSNNFLELWQMVFIVAVISMVYSLFLRIKSKEIYNKKYGEAFLHVAIMSLLTNIMGYVFYHLMANGVDCFEYIWIFEVIMAIAMVLMAGAWIWNIYNIEKVWKMTPVFLFYAFNITISQFLYFEVSIFQWGVRDIVIASLKEMVILGFAGIVTGWLIFMIINRVFKMDIEKVIAVNMGDNDK